MNPTPRTPGWYLITRHWLSLAGLALIITAAISALFVAPEEVRRHASNPYLGIILLLIVPFIFFAGLAMVPIGVYLKKREIRRGLAEATIDRRTALKRFAWFLGITAAFNILIGTQLTYRAIEHMETPQFCGASCHSMKPEFTAYQNSPHSRVECVECHVTPGAAGWIASKASGVRQLVHTILGTESRPVPSALESGRLVPSRETCENCHWPQKFAGVRLRVFSKFAEDETNTRSETVLLMLIGGDKISGIHGAHLGPGVHIRFAAADSKRQTIPWVEYRNTATGEARTFAASDARDSSKLPKFDMQCVDCHNRPTHTFELPDRAMDKALTTGEIPASLPFIKQQGVQALKTEYRTSSEAADKLPKALWAYYQQTYPAIYADRAQDIGRAAEAILRIYNRNVFPDLKVGWGTYPNNLGHTDFPGCFRCHDGSHAAADGKTIAQECNTCHEPLAIEEASPAILTTLGITDRLVALQRQ
jgi:hypothetical protein